MRLFINRGSGVEKGTGTNDKRAEEREFERAKVTCPIG